MKIKIKYPMKDGMVRIENAVNIREVLINEDLLHPEKKSICLGFTNRDSSGLVEFSPKEMEGIVRGVREKQHLIKGVKIFREEKQEY